MNKNDRDWIVECWAPLADSPIVDIRFIDLTLLPKGKDGWWRLSLGDSTLEDAMMIAKHYQRACRRPIQYRVRNVITDDILPAAIL
jgi:hypothetical protein